MSPPDASTTPTRREPVPVVPGYRILDHLGSGSSGRVFRACREGTGEVVALKAAHACVRYGHEDVAFRLEFLLHSSLLHPAIVRADQFGEAADGRRFYTMEYVEPTSLREVFVHGGFSAIGEVALRVLEALEYAHARGVLHADVKPANILVSMIDGAVEKVRLGDFGLAQRAQDLAARNVQGTLAYLAPERLLGWRIDARSDLYSLGASLLEAITGSPSIRAGGNGSSGAHGGSIAGRLLAAIPDIEPGWATLLDSLVAAAPAARPACASDVIDRLLALIGGEDRRASAGSASAPWIGPPLRLAGRTEALEAIDAAYRDVEGPRALILRGDEGVGKTRLVEEIVQSIELDRHRVLRTDASDPGASPLRGGVPQSSENGGFRSRALAFESAAEALLGDAADDVQGTVFVFDALEAADADLLEWVLFLSMRLRGTRSFLFAIVRDTETTDAIDKLRRGDFGEIALAPMTRGETLELLAAILEDSGRAAETAGGAVGEEAADELADWIVERCDGNPRRTITTVQELVRRGFLVREPSGWLFDRRALSASEMDSPAASRFSARIVELPSGERELLEIAAALGVEFDARDLARLGEPTDETLNGFLAHALRLGILRHGHGGESCYRFTSASAARELEASLDPLRRGALFSRIVDDLESGGAADASPERLAHFTERAGRPARAVELYVAAVAAARAKRDHPAAARCAASAWRLLSEEGRAELPGFVTDWVHSLHTMGRIAKLDELVESMLAGATPAAAVGPTGAILRVLHGMTLASLSRWEESYAILSSLQRGKSRLENPGLEAWALAELGRVLAALNRRDEAQATLLRALKLAGEVRDARVTGLCEMRLGLLAWRRHDLDDAYRWHQRAHETLGHAEGEELLPSVWAHLGAVHVARLEFREAVRMHRRSAEGFGRQIQRRETARAYQNLATALLEIGSWADADAALDQANLWNRTTGGPRELSHYAWGRARLALCRGLIEEAAHHVARCVELSRATGNAHLEVAALTLSALVDLAREDREAARASAARALELSRGAGYPWGVAKGLYLQAQAAPPGSEERLERIDEAARVAEPEKIESLLFRIDLLRAETLAARGRLAEGARILDRCRTLQAKSESPYWDALLRFTEARIHSAANDPKAACESLTLAYEGFSRLGAEQARAEVLSAQAAAWWALGNGAGARSAWRQSRTIREQLALPAEACPFEDGADLATGIETVRRVLEVTSAISRVTTRVAPLSRVLESVLKTAIVHLGAERGVIALVDPETQRLAVRFAHNIDRESLPDSLEISRSALARIREGKGWIATGDALADPGLGRHASIRKFRIRSLAAVPIRRDKELIGVLYMDHRELVDLFGEEQRLFLEFIAEMAAIGIHNAKQWEIAREESRTLREELSDEGPSIPGVIGTSAAMREAAKRLRRAAKGNQIVLLRGPTGSGKDHLASALHALSGRRGKFVDCFLPSIPQTLFESELFGVTRGTATGVDARRGLVEEANDGTLFLNEIGDIALSVQEKVLHLLGKREYRPVGGAAALRKTNALIVCATNADLEQRVAQGLFREDLAYRIRGFVIDVPPLCDRPEDVSALVEHVLREEGGAQVSLTPEAMERMLACPWRGNVRELMDCVRSALLGANGPVIEAGELDSPSLREMPQASAGKASSKILDELEKLEMRRIAEALRRSGGMIAPAGRDLRLHEATLRRKIDKYGLRHLVLPREGRRRPKGGSA